MAHNMKIDTRAGKANHFAMATMNGQDAKRNAWWDDMAVNSVDEIRDYIHGLELTNMKNWKILCQPAAFQVLPATTIDDGFLGVALPAQWQTIPNRFQVCRVDTDDAGNILRYYPFNEVTERYAPFQPSELFEAMQDAVDEFGFKWKSMGATGDGELIYGTLQGDTYGVGKSTHEAYLNGSLSFNGTSAFRMGIGDFCLECWNTATFWGNAVDAGKVGTLSIKQTKNAAERLSAFRAQLAETVGMTKTMQEKMRLLASKVMRHDTMDKAVLAIALATKQQTVADKGKSDEEKVSALKTRTANRIERFLQILHGNKSNVPSDLRGTAYDVLQAFTYEATHNYVSRATKGKNSDEAAAKSNMIGGAQKMGETAFNMLVEMQADGSQVIVEQKFFDFGAVHPKDETPLFSATVGTIDGQAVSFDDIFAASN